MLCIGAFALSVPLHHRCLCIIGAFACLGAFQKERMVSPHYMRDTQTEIDGRMRAILVDWLVDVHARFKVRRRYKDHRRPLNR